MPCVTNDHAPRYSLFPQSTYQQYLASLSLSLSLASVHTVVTNKRNQTRVRKRGNLCTDSRVTGRVKASGCQEQSMAKSHAEKGRSEQRFMFHLPISLPYSDLIFQAATVQEFCLGSRASTVSPPPKDFLVEKLRCKKPCSLPAFFSLTLSHSFSDSRR